MKTFTRLLSTAILSQPFVFLSQLTAEKPDPSHPPPQILPVVEGGKAGNHRGQHPRLPLLEGEDFQHAHLVACRLTGHDDLSLIHI